MSRALVGPGGGLVGPGGGLVGPGGLADPVDGGDTPIFLGDVEWNNWGFLDIADIYVKRPNVALVVGDLLLASIIILGDYTDVPVVTAPVGWELIASHDEPISHATFLVYQKFVTDAGHFADTYTFNFSGIGHLGSGSITSAWRRTSGVAQIERTDQTTETPLGKSTVGQMVAISEGVAVAVFQTTAYNPSSYSDAVGIAVPHTYLEDFARIVEPNDFTWATGGLGTWRQLSGTTSPMAFEVDGAVATASATGSTVNINMGADIIDASLATEIVATVKFVWPTNTVANTHHIALGIFNDDAGDWRAYAKMYRNTGVLTNGWYDPSDGDETTDTVSVGGGGTTGYLAVSWNLATREVKTKYWEGAEPDWQLTQTVRDSPFFEIGSAPALNLTAFEGPNPAPDGTFTFDEVSVVVTVPPVLTMIVDSESYFLQQTQQRLATPVLTGDTVGPFTAILTTPGNGSVYRRSSWLILLASVPPIEFSALWHDEFDRVETSGADAGNGPGAEYVWTHYDSSFDTFAESTTYVNGSELRMPSAFGANFDSYYLLIDAPLEGTAQFNLYVPEVGPALDYGNPEIGLAFELAGANWSIYVRSVGDDGSMRLTSENENFYFAAIPGSWITVKMRWFSDGSGQAKAWQVGDDEPDWMLTDAVANPGSFGLDEPYTVLLDLYYGYADDSDLRVDDLFIFTGDPDVTPPATIIVEAPLPAMSTNIAAPPATILVDAPIPAHSYVRVPPPATVHLRVPAPSTIGAVHDIQMQARALYLFEVRSIDPTVGDRALYLFEVRAIVPPAGDRAIYLFGETTPGIGRKRTAGDLSFTLGLFPAVLRLRTAGPLSTLSGDAVLWQPFDIGTAEAPLDQPFDIIGPPAATTLDQPFDIIGLTAAELDQLFDIEGPASAELDQLFDITSAVLNRVQIITGGNFTGFVLTFDGQSTGLIAGDADAATVQAALEALPNIAPGDIVVTGGPLNG